MPPTKESLVGTWKLVSFTETNESREVRDGFGPNPIGFLTYAADGRVSVIMARTAHPVLPNKNNHRVATELMRLPLKL
jgi:hypothetical protein